MPDLDQISNRDLIIEMRSDIKAMMLSHAVLAERVSNASTLLEKHVIDDDRKHEKIDAEIAATNKTAADLKEWRAKIMGIVIVAGGALGFLGSLARDAIAAAFRWN